MSGRGGSSGAPSGAGPGRWVFIYAASASAWIVLSDWFVSDSSVGTQTVKGLGFVVVTSLLLYALMRRWRGAVTSAEGRLHFVRERFKALYDRVDEPVLIIRGRGEEIVDCNPAVERVLGYSPEDLVGQPTDVLRVDGDEWEAIEREARSAIAKRGVTRVDQPLRRKDGEVVETQQTIAFIDDTRWIIRIIRDVSREVRASETIKRQRAYLESLLANVTDVVTVVGPDGETVYANPTLGRVLGYSREEIVGTRALKLVHPDDRAHVEAALSAAADDPGTIWQIEHRSRHRDGGWIELDSTGVRPVGGAVEGVVVSSRDVSQQREAERELSEKERQLQRAQRMEAIGRLAGGMAHDFNNLLTVIMSYTAFLEDAVSEGSAKEDLQVIDDAAAQAAKLTEQLLLFSRRQVAEPSLVNVNEVIEGLRKMLQRPIGEDITLELVLGPGIPNVLVDESLLGQVFLNLVINARDAMPNGGRVTIATGCVEVGPEQAEISDIVPGRFAQIRISDTGHGMDEDTMAHIFEPFFTTKAEGRGTGLGLSTSFGIVRQARGFIDVQSAPGRGSTFSVHLPEGELADAAPRTVPARESGTPSRHRVLLVEDDEWVRQATRRLLERAGYQVTDVADGREALATAAREPFDLLITDVVMPGMNGFELAARMSEEHGHDRVLFMSGYTPEELLTRDGKGPPGRHMLRKPFAEPELLSHVRDVLAEDPATA